MDHVSVWVNASPEQIWPLVSDITRYGEWSPENQGGKWVSGAPGPGRVGAKFIGSNKHGALRWSTHCTVTESQECERFAFLVTESRAEWGFELKPENNGTLLSQWREKVGVMPLPFRMLERSGLLGKPRDTWVVDGMRQTIDAIKRVAERSVELAG